MATVAHLVGALLTSLGLGVASVLLAAWSQDRASKRRVEDISLALGVPASAIEADDSHMPRIFEYNSRHFSADLIANRVSDLCGTLRTAWSWLGLLVQVGIVAGVFWSMFDQGRDHAVLMWFVPAAAVFFWIVGIAFSFACLLLTGRYPGESRAVRKGLAAYLNQHNAPTSRVAAEQTDVTS